MLYESPEKKSREVNVAKQPIYENKVKKQFFPRLKVAIEKNGSGMASTLIFLTNPLALLIVAIVHDAPVYNHADGLLNDGDWHAVPFMRVADEAVLIGHIEVYLANGKEPMYQGF